MIMSGELNSANEPHATMRQDDAPPAISSFRPNEHVHAATVVNSYNDWCPLQEVILGTPFHLDYSNDVSFRLFFYMNLLAEPHIDSTGRWETIERQKASNRMRDEMEEDLADFCQVLLTEHIVLRRPTVLNEAKLIQTPAWKAPMGHALMPRDIFLVVGEEIIETPPMVRARYFETDLYKELLTEYFLAGAKWTVAPRSRLLDRNFDYSYVQEHGYIDEVPSNPFFEIMFDGAQILRLGRDLIFNCSTANHRMGAVWLQRHLGENYRVRVVNITDNHIDASVVALRPGTLLVQEGLQLQSLPEPLRAWDIIEYNAVDDTVEWAQRAPLLASQSIGLNVLSLDEERVVVQDIQVGLIRKLERAGFTPIPCRWRHGRSVGGGFHCLTLDIRRQGALEDYFRF